MLTAVNYQGIFANSALPKQQLLEVHYSKSHYTEQKQGMVTQRFDSLMHSIALLGYQPRYFRLFMKRLTRSS
jgi:hypothetical protein